MNHSIFARAPGPQSCFFGFHDLCPWSPDNTHVLLLRVDPEIRHMPRPNDKAEVILWNPENNTVEVVGETTTWNFQQGARAMWLPGEGRRLLFNRKVDDRPGSEIFDLDRGERRVLPHAVGSVAPNGEYAFAPNFARLGVLWQAYGYSGFLRAADLHPCPDDDGLWRIEMASGARNLVFSMKTLAAVPGASVPEGAKLFVTHVSFNREGSCIVFMMRFFSRDGALYSLIFSARPDGSELRLLAQEKISHFDWIDEDNIVLWMRKSPAGLAAARKSGLLASPLFRPLVQLARRFRGRLKGKLLNERYFIVSTATGAKQPFMANVLLQDGHPMISPDRHWMIVDEYPDRDGTTPLMLVDMKSRSRVDLCTFQHDVGSADTDLKCDLHPRWNRTGTQVGVDATDDGRRCFTIIDLSEHVESS